MRDWDAPGRRPFAFWLELGAKVRQLNKECATEAEAVLLVGDADAAERKRIKAEGIIRKQRDALAEDRRKNPNMWDGPGMLPNLSDGGKF